MGCSAENIWDLKNEKALVKKFGKRTVSLENRVFVCMGSNKYTQKRETWLMIYSRDFKSIKFHDVKNNISFNLRGRVRSETASVLRAYLTFDADDPELTKEGNFMDYIKMSIFWKKVIFRCCKTRRRGKVRFLWRQIRWRILSEKYWRLDWNRGGWRW